MPTVSDYLETTIGSGVAVAIQKSVWVQFTNNSTATTYVSTAATDTAGHFTITGVPVGVYTVATGPSNAGPWTATGQANYVVSTDGSSASLPLSAVSGYDSNQFGKGGDPWYDIRAYGAKVDGTTDDSAAVNAALAAAKVTGGKVLIPPGITAVASTVALTLNGTTNRGVIIQGAGRSYSPNSTTGTLPASTLKWTGAATGTVVSVGFGQISLRDLQIDCNGGTADFGVDATDIQSASWDSVHVIDDNQWAYRFTAASAGVYNNSFRSLTNQIATGAGGGCLLTGTNASFDVAENDWIGCRFFTNGSNAALDLASADNNSFFKLAVNRGGGGVTAAANALIFRAASGAALGATNNFIFHLDGGGGTPPIVHDVAATNVVFGLDYANGLAAPSGANPDYLMIFGASTGATWLGRHRPTSGIVLNVGELSTGFASGNLGMAVKDTTSPVIRLERTGQTAYELYISSSDNTLHLGPLVMNGSSLRRNINTQAFAASLTVSAAAGDVVNVGALTAAITINAPTNAAAGQQLTFLFVQDGTGGRTVAWNAIFLQSWSDTGNTAGKHSSITFVYDGTNWVQVGAQRAWA